MAESIAYASLRVLVADEDTEHLTRAAEQLHRLGHEVVARALRVQDVAAAVADERPDLAVVRVVGDTEHALDLVTELVDAVTCPVIAMLDTENPEFVRRAAAIGLLGFSAPGPPAALQSAIELALRRFGDLERLTAEVGELRGALQRRVVIERAKGILMERHDIAEEEAYRLLRDYARRHRQALDQAAETIIQVRPLLPDRRPPPPVDEPA